MAALLVMSAFFAFAAHIDTNETDNESLGAEVNDTTLDDTLNQTLNQTNTTDNETFGAEADMTCEDYAADVGATGVERGEMCTVIFGDNSTYALHSTHLEFMLDTETNMTTAVGVFALNDTMLNDVLRLLTQENWTVTGASSRPVMDDSMTFVYWNTDGEISDILQTVEAVEEGMAGEEDFGSIVDDLLDETNQTTTNQTTNQTMDDTDDDFGSEADDLNETDQTGSENTSDVVMFEGDLSGDEEVPEVNTDATGDFTASLTGNLLSVTGNFEDLESELEVVGESSAHIHLGEEGEAGSVVFPLQVFADSDDMSGTFGFSGELTEEQRGDLLDGMYYINVHTQDNPEGEIRGQLIQTS